MINKILKQQIELVKPDEEIMKSLIRRTGSIVGLLEEDIKKLNVSADVFVGGSFAKGSLVKKENYDIDIFIRFDWRIEDISNVLESVVREICKKEKMKLEILHGSRDYFRIIDKEALFEIVPVYRIKKPKEARNVTDLSYFHVNYVRKKLKGGKLGDEILLAKSFCQAQGVYGAESYIQGFSGYALECLIIYYKSFLKMLKELSKVKDRLVIDIEKYYKNKNDALFSLNEARLQSPVILIDPTWKERNVLAALNKESFLKFQESSREFLKKPSLAFFKVKEISVDKLKKSAKKRDAQFVHVRITTDRQEGDIAGTKMKKFSRFLEREIGKYFSIIEREFSYLKGQKAELYLVVKPKDKVLIYGPPISMEKNAKGFKKRHKNVYEKDGKLYSEIKVNFSCKSFLKNWIKDNKMKMYEMGIVGMKVC